MVQIHYSTRFRDTFCRQSLENVEPLYRALKTFSALIYDPQNLVEMQLKTGTDSRCLLFPGPGRGFFCVRMQKKNGRLGVLNRTENRGIIPVSGWGV